MVPLLAGMAGRERTAMAVPSALTTIHAVIEGQYAAKSVNNAALVSAD